MKKSHHGERKLYAYFQKNIIQTIKNQKIAAWNAKRAFASIQIGVTKNWKQHKCRKNFWRFLKIWNSFAKFVRNVDKPIFTAE